MAETIDQQLEQAQGDIYRLNKVDSMMDSLKQRKEQLEAECGTLKRCFEKEQTDVDKLNEPSLAAFFHSMIGNKADRLEKEQKEAMAARLKYETAKGELEDVTYQWENLTRERSSLRDSKARYERLLEDKKRQLISEGGSGTAEIQALNQEKVAAQAEVKELEEALLAGRQVQVEIDRVLGSLNSAEGWGTWDMLGGGMLTTMAKHSHINQASSDITGVQKSLSRFKTELADVKVTADMNIAVDGFLSFADYFFDSLIMDWMVQSKIHDSKEQVNQVKRQVDGAMQKLRAMEQTKKADMEAVERRIADVIKGAIM